MSENSSYKIIKGKTKPELEKFAAWFHQDWALIYSDFEEGADMYIRSLTPDQKKPYKRN